MGASIRTKRGSIQAREHSIRGVAPARSQVSAAVSAGGARRGRRSIPSRPLLDPYAEAPQWSPPGAVIPVAQPRAAHGPYMLEAQPAPASKLAEVRGKLARSELERERLIYLLTQALRYLDAGDVPSAKVTLSGAT